MWKSIQFMYNFVESGDAAAALVLTALMTILTRCPHFMKQSILVENFMTSVERIVEYGTLEPEAYLKESEDTNDKLNDMLKGPIAFEHVWLRYAKDEEYVLKDISFTLHDKEKVKY